MTESLDSPKMDFATIGEEEFELHTTYIVPDLPVKDDEPNRAEATLPRNLVLKPTNAISDVSQSCRLSALWLTVIFVAGSGRLEHRVHPTGNEVWPPRGRNLRQRCRAVDSQPEVLLAGKFGLA